MIKKIYQVLVFSDIVNYTKYLISPKQYITPKQYISPMKKFPPIPSNTKIK